MTLVTHAPPRWLIALFTSIVLLAGTFSPTPVIAQENQFAVALPELTGDYAVGYRAYALVDESREEVFTKDEGDSRRFPLFIYYPAAPAEDVTPAPYATEAEVKAYNQALGIPALIFNSIISHAYLDAPLAEVEGGFPVLLFSPGFGTPVKYYTALLEEVASHGYIVAAVDHPYSQLVSIFPDGEVIKANPAGSAVSDDKARMTLLDVWVGDTVFALDELERLNTDDPLLAGAFDFSRVGAFGHSFGGAVSAEASIVDQRILASINMDGSMDGQAASGVPKPFMMMMSEAIEVSDEELEAAGMTREELDKISAGYQVGIDGAVNGSEAGYKFRLLGSRHNTYTSEMPLLRALLPMFIDDNQVGTIDGVRAHEVISTYVLAFFDQYVRGEDASPLLEGNSADYPEVVLELSDADS